MLNAVWVDLRQAFRTLLSAPSYSFLVIGALTLGIGANAAIFTVVYDVLMRPLPYRAPGELVSIWSDDTKSNKPQNPISPADFLDLRERSRAFLSLEGYFSFITDSKVILEGRSEIVRTVSLTTGTLELLGRSAGVGDIIHSSDTDRVVLSAGYFRRRFGANPQTIGRAVIVDGARFTIVGVMPDDFVFPYKGMLGPSGFSDSLDVDLWMPLEQTSPRFIDSSRQPIRGVRFLGAVGRLRPGVTVERVSAELSRVAAALEADYPDTNSGWRISVAPLHSQVVRAIRPALSVLAGGVSLILLIACINVAHMVLARAVRRRKDLAIRAALGAAPLRLVTQAVAESLLLVVLGTIGGAVAALWGIRALVSIAPGELPRLHEVHPDVIVIATSAVAAIVAAVAVGIVPAFVAGRTDAHAALQESSRGSVGSRSAHRLRSVLVVAEVALALALSIAAVLLLRSFARLLGVDPGFRVDHVLTLQMNIPDRLTTADARRAFYGAFFEKMEALPGVVAAGGTTRIPLGSTSVSTSLQVEGRPLPQGDLPMVEFRRAMKDYFGAMGIPILAGRAFTKDDGPDAAPVAIVNQTLSRRIFRGASPVGQHVRTGPNPSGPWLTIVGVIGDVRHSALDQEPEPELYISSLQNPPVSPFIALRTRNDPAALAEQVRSAARDLDPGLTVYDIRTMDEIHAASVADRRFVLMLTGLFGLLSIALVILGVYGVMALVASDRTREVGVRLALGANPASVFRLIVSDAVKLAVVGCAIGLAIAAAMAPLISRQLFGVQPIDPLTFAVTPIAIVCVAVLAAAIPAWRAMQIDPASVLN